MTPSNYHPTKVFTVEQANARLPLVRMITADMIDLSQELNERQKRLEQLMAGRDRDSSDVYREELSQIEDELAKEAERLAGYQEEIRQLGAEPEDAEQGLIDFPSMLDGRLVFLCWQYDEPEILHWHEVDAGFAARQPLTAGSIAGDDCGEGHEAVDGA